MKKKTRLFLLVILPPYLLLSLSYVDKKYLASPIEYKGDVVIRSDSRGDGLFSSPRSGNRMHEGIDLFAPIGTPVLAAASGRVAVAREKNNGMGNYVVMKHAGGVVTIYGHLSQICVTQGRYVRQGAVIGRVGKTGNANSRSILPHLHFEVRKNGALQDPLSFLE